MVQHPCRLVSLRGSVLSLILLHLWDELLRRDYEMLWAAVRYSVLICLSLPDVQVGQLLSRPG